MSTRPSEFQFAITHLSDVDALRNKIKSGAESNAYMVEKYADMCINDAVANALKQAHVAERNGADASELKMLIFEKKAMLCSAVAHNWLSHGNHAAIVNREEIVKWAKCAAEAFEEAVLAKPNPKDYFNLGLVYKMLCNMGENYKAHALAALHQAEKGDDVETSLDAIKEIHKVEAISVEAAAASVRRTGDSRPSYSSPSSSSPSPTTSSTSSPGGGCFGIIAVVFVLGGILALVS